MVHFWGIFGSENSSGMVCLSLLPLQVCSRSKVGQNTPEEFLAKFGFTPTPNRWELRLALSVGGGLGGGPALSGCGSPLPTSCGLGGATKRYYFFRDL